MFCPKCGSQIPDNAAACPNCGEKMEAKAENVTAQSEVVGNVQGEINNDDNKKNNVIVKIAAAVAAVVVVILLISSLFGSSYKDPVKKLVKLCNKKEESSIEYNYINQPKFLADYTKTYEEILAKSDYDDDYKNTYEYVFDDWEDTYGEDFKVKLVKIKDVEKMDKDDIKDYQESMREYVEDKDDREDLVDDMKDSLEYYEDNYDLSKKDSKKILSAYKKMLKKMAKVKISKGYEMDIEIKIKGEDGKAEFKEKQVEIIKVDGDWIFVNSYTPSTLDSSFE